MDLKPWPSGAIGLVSGRTDDPFTRVIEGQTSLPCYNCQRKIRVSGEHLRLSSEGNYCIICIQCFLAYQERARHPVRLYFREEYPVEDN